MKHGGRATSSHPPKTKRRSRETEGRVMAYQQHKRADAALLIRLESARLLVRDHIKAARRLEPLLEQYERGELSGAEFHDRAGMSYPQAIGERYAVHMELLHFRMMQQAVRCGLSRREYRYIIGEGSGSA